jgi:DeoR/GlpR family transcriptional regulator of sugar metabolism
MHVDVCIIGIDAVSLSGGLMISNLEEVSLKRSMIAAANKVVVVCDHTKSRKRRF